MVKRGNGKGRRAVPTEVAHNVFLTWSRERARMVALALHKWLPRMIQQCRPWISAQDIFAGQKWRAEMDAKLGSTGFGVLCLTKENVGDPWVNFEAGALSTAVSPAVVVPYCFRLKPTDYPDPLGGFQGVEADRDGTHSLVRSINAAMPTPLEKEVLEDAFERSWGPFKKELDAIPQQQPDEQETRSDRSILVELLTRVRELDSALQGGTAIRDDVAPLGSFYPVGPNTVVRGIYGIPDGPLQRMFDARATHEAAVEMVRARDLAEVRSIASRVPSPAELEAQAAIAKAERGKATEAKKKDKK